MADTERIAPLFVPVIDEENFILLGGIKIARWIPDRGTLAFHDKDDRRVDRRRAECVEVKILQLVDFLETLC